MDWTDKELNDAEESVVKMAEATGLADKEIVEVISDGFSMKYAYNLPERVKSLVDELRATFDAY